MNFIWEQLRLAITYLSRPKRVYRRRRWGRPVMAATRAAIPEPNDLSDPRSQMAFIARVDFEPQPILNKSEHKVLLMLESVARTFNSGLRVMAQTSMGEIVRPKNGSGTRVDCDLAYRSINSKRLDFVVVDRFGIPVVAVEYHGHGHYRAGTFMRDAVKREVLRKSNITFIEIPADYEPREIVRSVRSALLDCSRSSQA